MPTPCQKGRCPARADVYDWNTTEYRKGCRRTQCQAAHRLAAQRAKTKKAEKRAAAEAAAAAAVPAAAPAEPTPAFPAFDFVAEVRANIEELKPTHPLTKALTGTALALAREVQLRTSLADQTAAPAAKQLVEVLERLMPTKTGSLEDELRKLFEDDDEDEPAATG